MAIKTIENLQAEITKLLQQEENVANKLGSIKEKLNSKKSELEQMENAEKQQILDQTFEPISLDELKKLFVEREKILAICNLLVKCKDISTILDVVKDTIREIEPINVVSDKLSESSQYEKIEEV